MPVRSAPNQVHTYFETAVLTFNCGDINALLKNPPKNEKHSNRRQGHCLPAL